MTNLYGTDRVMEPQNVLPTSAWQLDNSRNIRPGELRVSLIKVHLESTSFKQIAMEAGENDEKIRRTIYDIVIRRGKLHNPVTDTGGLAYGVVDQIGPEYDNRAGLRVGDRVIVNASLTSIPMYLENLGAIDRGFTEIEAEGYAIIHDKIPVVRPAEGVPVRLLMQALDESGTLFRLSMLAPGKENFLVVGNNMITNLLYGCVIRRAAGPNATIVCLLNKKTDVHLSGEGIDKLLSWTFNEIRYLDILRPTECMKMLNAESFYDLSVNCAEIPGAETINILATKPGGTVLFANLINNLNIALYITEMTSKHLQVLGAEGYLEGYAEFDKQLLSDIAEYFKGAGIIAPEKVEDDEEENPYSQPLLERAMQEDLVYKSRQMRNVLTEIMKVSKYDCNVIIFGDTGVGKEKVANIIQKNSDRKLQPFVKINCGAISPNLIESEFFGYEKGAFTGASATGKKGYFEIANNGVMFLDEIGELPLEMQAKLLRVIQDGEFYRVGGTTPVKTNVRIISATNRNLEQFVEEGKFRRDLYYRLNVVPIKIPKLADRPEDIPALVKHFLRKYGEKFGVKKTVAPSALEYLMQLQWPGNIRELENLVQRLIISAKGGEITLVDIMTETEAGTEFSETEYGRETGPEIRLEQAVEDYEKGIIRYACEKYGSTRKAASAIGISQTQLVRKKKKYGL